MQAEERINLRTTQERKKLIATAAAYSGTTLSAFLLETAEERAKKIMEEQMQIQLTMKDWMAFSRILDEADTKPRPRPRLEALIQEHDAE